MDDSIILEHYLNGNPEAFELCMQKYGTECIGMAMGILNDGPDSEKCVNEVMTEAYELLPLRVPNDLRTWMLKSVRNRAVFTYLSMPQSRRDIGLSQTVQEVSALVLPEMEDEEIGSLLSVFLRSLEPLPRKLFVGRYWYNYSAKELAATYGMTESDVVEQCHDICTMIADFIEKGDYFA